MTPDMDEEIGQDGREIEYLRNIARDESGFHAIGYFQGCVEGVMENTI